MFEGNSVAADGLIQNLIVVSAGILFLKNDGSHPRFVQNVRKFMRAVGGVDVDENSAGARCYLLQQNPFDIVGGPDAEAVLRFEV